MITFITWLRCLAAMLITNAHYTGIYPTDLIANGGLIGDILFFAVSGYCLTNIRTGFWKWYGKRISRILPAVILITLIYAVLGQYDLSSYALGTENTILYSELAAVGVRYSKWLSWFIYPTYYHFIGSILVLYIPYYFMMKSERIKKHIPAVMGIIFIAYVACYIFAYDKSYYHIDTVREPMIRFLFMESMLLGVWFRLNDEKLRNKGRAWVYAVGSIVAFGGYFVSKIFLQGGCSTVPNPQPGYHICPALSDFQVVQQHRPALRKSAEMVRPVFWAGCKANS
ncbi:MAG: acyltransferase [Lachnospiraceae bacterium]|nr:acyltransferase [Lachnospiraceae bacterium]